MKLVLFEKDTIHPDAVVLLKEKNIEVLEDGTHYDANTVEAIFVRTYTKVTEDFLKQFPSLKYIIRAGVGLDNIDVEACKKRNIQIIASPGSNANAVAELVVGFMLLLPRHLLHQTSQLKNRKWRDMSTMGEELKGKTIGIIGCGAIGQLVAKKLQSMEVGEILGYDPFLSEEVLKPHGIKKVELDPLLQAADMITLHLPLLPETKNLISKAKFDIMKQGSYIINTSRGGIVNETDLVAAMKSGKIAGAALDVFENEPEVNEELFSVENLITTPHIAALTKDADHAMSVQAAENFLKLLQ